jgi:hypothetical protein
LAKPTWREKNADIHGVLINGDSSAGSPPSLPRRADSAGALAFPANPTISMCYREVRAKRASAGQALSDVVLANITQDLVQGAQEIPVTGFALIDLLLTGQFEVRTRGPAPHRRRR